MIKFYTYNGFGNQLFTYSFNRCLAEKLNYRLEHKGHIIEGDKSGSRSKFYLPTYFHLDNNENGKIIKGDVQKINQSLLSKSRHILDFDIIKKNKIVITNGCYERFDQIQEYKNKIKNKWLIFKNPNSYHFDPNDVAIHIRCGDLDYRVVKMEFYHDALKLMKFNNIYIFTDTPSNPEILKFKNEYNAKLIYNSFIEDFKMLMSFKKLIYCNSTFSAWAGWLGKAEQIITIKRDNIKYGGWWYVNHSDIFKYTDYSPKENRYIYI